MEAINKENYNSKELVEMWAEFIDWNKRRIGEDGFLVKMLKKFKCKRVFDACLGDGVDSIYLIKSSFEVTSNELDNLFIAKADENARKEGVELCITRYDWRELHKHFGANYFDAVLCLGNSLTYLFNKEDQLHVLKTFRYMLRENGILIVDERNYQYFLDNRKEIITTGEYRYMQKYVYCGNTVHAKPIEISDKHVKMEYANEKTGKKGYLMLYPFKKGELLSLLKEAGFTKVEQYSDYKKKPNENADFYQYVCIR